MNAAGKTENIPPQVFPRVFEKNTISAMTAPPIKDRPMMWRAFIGYCLSFCSLLRARTIKYPASVNGAPYKKVELKKPAGGKFINAYAPAENVKMLPVKAAKRPKRMSDAKIAINK